MKVKKGQGKGPTKLNLNLWIPFVVKYSGLTKIRMQLFFGDCSMINFQPKYFYSAHIQFSNGVKFYNVVNK